MLEEKESISNPIIDDIIKSISEILHPEQYYSTKVNQFATKSPIEESIIPSKQKSSRKSIRKLLSFKNSSLSKSTSQDGKSNKKVSDDIIVKFDYPSDSSNFEYKCNTRFKH